MIIIIALIITILVWIKAAGQKMCFFISVRGLLVIKPLPSIWRFSARHTLRCIGALSADCWTRRGEQHLSPNGLSCWLIRWPEQTIRDEPGLHTHTHTRIQALKGLKGWLDHLWEPPNPVLTVFLFVHLNTMSCTFIATFFCFFLYDSFLKYLRYVKWMSRTRLLQSQLV